MLTAQLSQKYAKAMFDLAVEEDQLKEFGAQLSAVSAVVADHAELGAFIKNPLIKKEAKRDIFAKLFKKDISPLIYNFFMLLIDKRRESLLQEIAGEYKKLANDAQGILEAKVTVADALSEAQEARLIKKLQETTGKTVVIETKIDKSILGGVIVRIGDKLIDGSIVRQVQSLKTQLLTN